MKTTLPLDRIQGAIERLKSSNQQHMRRYPGEPGTRQPVHVVYGGAHLFAHDAAQKLGKLALRSLDEYAPDFVSFARAIPWLWPRFTPCARGHAAHGLGADHRLRHPGDAHGNDEISQVPGEPPWTRAELLRPR